MSPKPAPIIQLIKYSKHEWGVNSYDPSNTGRGTLRKAFRALRNLGVTIEAFELAVKDLLDSGNNVADFSVGAKDFLFSRFVCLDGPAPARAIRGIVGHA